MMRDRICVGAVLVREGGHKGKRSSLVLLGRRNAGRAYYPDVWDVLGGHLEPGETVERTLVRELREEAGVTPTAWRSFGVFHEPIPDGLLILHLYTVAAWTGVPRNRSPQEHSEVSWFSVEDACHLELAHPDYQGILRKAASGSSGSTR